MKTLDMTPFSSGGALAGMATVPATELKNEIGAVFDRLRERGALAVTRHNRPQAVLVSVEDYCELQRVRRSSLDSLEREFDQLLAGMQGKPARLASSAAFAASPDQLADAAVGSNARVKNSSSRKRQPPR